MNSLFFKDLETIKKDCKQYEAFQSMENSVIIAGPGSGKTRVLSLKTVSLAKSHIHKPCGLVCISYSRETVRELKKRLKSYGFIPNNNDFIGTVHGFSLLHVIEPFAHLYPQYNIKYPIKILPNDIENKLYNSTLNDLKIENPKDVTLIKINKHRSLSLRGRSIINIKSPEIIVRAAEIYEKKIWETEFMDFINIINVSAKIINEQEYVRETLKSQFPWILIDEYQDLGKALHEMVLELVFNAGIKLYAVGDMNQSIYGFNGGYPDFLHELTENDDIKTIELESNYRSSQHIIDASIEALNLPPPQPKYTSGTRKTDIADFTFLTCEEGMDEQYNIVATKVIPNLLSKKIPLHEIGIITSSNVQIHNMGYYMRKEKIPFYIVKWNFTNSAVVIWLQECAQWCINKDSQSFDVLFNFWRNLINNHNDIRKNNESIRLKTLFYRVLSLSSNTKNCYEWLWYITNKLSINETLKDSEIYPDEINNLEKLLDEARLYNLKDSKLNRFANLGFPENEVTITTRHSSKGLEFEAVILLGMEDGNFPHYYNIKNKTLEEDERLCYVCISRAKKTCILLRSKSFIRETDWGEKTYSYNPSRFWVALYKKFGNDSNTFHMDNYL